MNEFRIIHLQVNAGQGFLFACYEHEPLMRAVNEGRKHSPYSNHSFGNENEVFHIGLFRYCPLVENLPPAYNPIMDTCIPCTCILRPCTKTVRPSHLRRAVFSPQRWTA